MGMHMVQGRALAQASLTAHLWVPTHSKLGDETVHKGADEGSSS